MKGVVGMADHAAEVSGSKATSGAGTQAGAIPKKIGIGAHIGDSGVALIHVMVNKMGFVWHERTGTLDAGIEARSSCVTLPLVRSPTG